jgi:tetratricopeptide (TPR) repeat protein
MTLTAQSALAEHLEERRRWREALAVREAALSAARRRFGEQDVYVARALTGLGELHSAMQQHARAEPPLRRALEIRRRIHPEGHWRIAEAQVALATALAAAGRYAEAEELLTGAQALLAAAADAAPRDLGVRARDSIARIQDVRRRAGHARRER